MTRELLAAAILVAVQFEANAGTRSIPRPSPTHPGNIFTAAENVVLALPQGSDKTWRRGGADSGGY